MATGKHDPPRMAALDLAIAAACVAEASARLAVLLREGPGGARPAWREDYAMTCRYLARADHQYLTKAAVVRAHLPQVQGTHAGSSTRPADEHGHR